MSYSVRVDWRRSVARAGRAVAERSGAFVRCDLRARAEGLWFVNLEREEATMVRLNINGKMHNLDVDPNTPLLWAIREQAGLTGTKYGCGVAQCGACTVHVDGTPIRSCSVPASSVAGRKITTIEGLAKGGKLTKVQQAWINHDVPQCGYCQSGMIMAAAALLQANPKPTDADIDAAITNICRCGTFQEVRKAIHAAAKA
jgi:isoquinoline 1-oxidoreductase alpha subunit